MVNYINIHMPALDQFLFQNKLQIEQFQTGEIITFYMLLFTVLMTASVVAYYKCLTPTKCEELVGRLIHRRRS
uniref:Transmembrane protein n=1 Tax=Heterorhabditis bacteriophora TaxID=37862 RepID=A0A1I7W7H5_HETBA